VTGRRISKGLNGLRGGDPAKLAKVLVQLASQNDPPLRWAAGADAIGTFEKKAKDLLAQGQHVSGSVLVAGTR
jgi:hypothetical protein